MFCTKCGTAITGDVAFCRACGAVLSEDETDGGASEDIKDDPAQHGFATVAVSPAGQIIEGKYRVDARLGAGGMGTVYRATRLFIGDSVALKVLHPEMVSDEQAAARFRREAQAAARLKHPNAVSVYDFGITHDGLVYLVMELVEGESLRDMIKRQGPLSLAAAIEITRQVCAALDEAHSRNIVHRDIKPDNIIVHTIAQSLHVKILDFGVARIRDAVPAAGSLTQTGMMVGTPRYMSPEQCLGEEVDGRSDIYSTGVVLYEMLTGTVPFNSPTPTAVAVQHATQAPPSLRAINMSVPAAVETVVLHALEKRRESRPQTAGALASELIESASEGTLPRGSVNAAPPFVQGLGSSSLSARPNSGDMPTIVLDASVRQSRATAVVGAASYGASERATKRSLTPWIGGIAVGVLVGVSAFAFFLKGGSSNAERKAVSNNESEVNRNVSNIDLKQSLAPQAKEISTPQPTVEMPRQEFAKKPPSGALGDAQGARACLEGWVAATRDHDFETHMSFYADMLSFYYKRSNVSIATVRADRARAFTRYAKLDVQLSNVVVTPDPTGLTATATFDKTWNFEGDKNSSGAVRQTVSLENVGGRWLITGEKDLQIYYVNR
jgi:serine/threonine protein kinase/ketosteroid isomerase-like protein